MTIKPSHVISHHYSWFVLFPDVVHCAVYEDGVVLSSQLVVPDQWGYLKERCVCSESIARTALRSVSIMSTSNIFSALLLLFQL